MSDLPKMNGNSFVMAGNSGRRCRSWRWIITTVSKKRRRNFSASERNRNSALPNALCLCSRRGKFVVGLHFIARDKTHRRSQGRAEAFGRSRSRIRTFTLQWLHGRSILTRKYIYTRDRQWVMRESPRIHFWRAQPFRFGII